MESQRTLALHELPDDELLRRLHELVAYSHRLEVDLVAHIGEVDERRLYARQAFPSMFAYCTEGLHLSEAEAYRRITVARAARKHQVLLSMLRDGRLHLSGIALLVPLLTEDNREAILARATHCTKRQIEELVAELSPRPDVSSTMRKLPGSAISRRSAGRWGDRTAEAAELVPGGVGPRSLLTSADACSTRVLSSTSVGMPIETPTTPPIAKPAHLASTRSGPSRVEPLSPGRYRVQFTASAELRDKLERLTALMRSEVPSGDLAAILERAVTEKLERLETRRFARSVAPRKRLADTDTTPTSRHVPAAVRRAVHERDGSRCRFVDEQGRRCSERHRLEFHHRHPFGMGGNHDPANISLLCSTHNRQLAEHDYGVKATLSRARPR